MTDVPEPDEDHAAAAELWHEAKEKGIILVGFSTSKGVLTAAMREEDLNEACRRAGLDPDSWDDVYSLGLGLFVSIAVPGSGETELESYQNALKKYDENPPQVAWPPLLGEDEEDKPNDSDLEK